MIEKSAQILVGTGVSSLEGFHLKLRCEIRHPSERGRNTVKKGKVTIPHPKKDLVPGTVKSIFKQAGISEEDLI